jgi:hypothetical protein
MLVLIRVIVKDFVTPHALGSHFSQTTINLDIGIFHFLDMRVDHAVRIAPLYSTVHRTPVLALLHKDRETSKF